MLGVITFIMGIVVNADKVLIPTSVESSTVAYSVANLLLRALVMPSLIVIIASIYAIILKSNGF